MGYGGLPNFTEYDSAGHVLLDGTLGKNVQNFRTYLVAVERARRRRAPSVVAQSGGAGTLTVSVSWNGATDVASWRVLAGASPSALAPSTSAPKAGFQTTITAPTAGPVRAGAGARRLGQRDRHLGNGQRLSRAPRTQFARCRGGVTRSRCRSRQSSLRQRSLAGADAISPLHERAPRGRRRAPRRAACRRD